MLRRLLRMTLWLSATAGAVYAVAKLVQARRAREAPPAVELGPWPPVEAPAPATEPAAEPATQAEPATEPAWVEPAGDGCPPGYPVKAKLSSGIFHLPGGLSYERTRPDRCYRSADAAEADGLRPSKR